MTWLYISISAINILTLFANYYLVFNTSIDNKDKLKTYAYISLALGISLCFATYIATDQDTKQKDRIEKLDTINNDLDSNIKRLSELNIKIDSTTNQVTQSIKGLVDTNIILTNRINDLTISNNNLIAISRKENGEGFARNTFAGEFTFRFKKNYLPIDNLTLDVGNNFVTKEVRFFGGGFRVGKDVPVIIYIKNNILMISAKFYDSQRNLVFEVKDNKWRANTHILNKLNFDGRGVELIDDNDIVRCSIDIISDSVVRIRGVFFDGNRASIVGDYAILTLRLASHADSVEYRDSATAIKKIFNYTGNHWVGKRA